MAICNKSSTTNIFNDTTEEKTETELTEEKEQKENKIRKGKCSDYRSFKPNTIDIQSENLGIIPDINTNKNINNCINTIQHDKPHDKTVENYRNIVEGFDDPLPTPAAEAAAAAKAAGEGLDIPNTSLSATDGVRNILLLIISGLISVFVFALFIFGPFVFWSMHARNRMYGENNACYKTFTILERFFPYANNKAPYNWIIGNENNWCYPKREKQPSISIDTCMDNQVNISGIGTKSDIISYLESLLKGFPYNINRYEDDEKYSLFRGGPVLVVALLTSITTCFWIYSLSTGFSSDNSPWEITLNTVAMLLIGLIGPGTLHGLIKVFMEDNSFKNNATKQFDDIDPNYNKALIIIPAIFSIIAASINATNKVNSGDDNPVGSSFAIITGIILFIIFSRISRNLNNIENPDNDYCFTKLPGKILHFIRKCITNGYIENLKSYRRTFHQGFDIIGRFFKEHLPHPVFATLFVFFGSVIIPLILGIMYFIGFVISVYRGHSGMFRTNTANSETDVNKSSIGEQARKTINKLSNKVLNTRVSDIRKITFKNTKIYAWILTLFFINFVLNMIFSLVNTLLTFLTYTIVPFLYPDIIASIFKCNVKYLIIVFGLGLLSTLWYYQDKKNGINFGLTNDILAWMTVTFVVISFFTITS